MPDDRNQLATLEDGADLATIFAAGQSPALSIMMNERLFAKAKTIADLLSRADGFIPAHLIGKPAACFAVVVRSLTWKLDPYAVASATYQTPGGRIGYEGKLCQAILENSGYLIGPVRYTHYGDWDRVKGKYQIKSGNSGKPYPAATWTREDAKGLGVTVSAAIRGEVEPRTLDFDLDECFPLNSTLWATRPKQQICYTAVRAFANIAAPGLFMGVPFDPTEDHFGPDRAVDVTPRRPTREEFDAPTTRAEPQRREAEAAVQFEMVTAEGEAVTHADASAAANALYLGLKAAAPNGRDALEGLWESNAPLLADLRANDAGDLADLVLKGYGELLDEVEKREAPKAAAPAEPKPEPRQAAKVKAAVAPALPKPPVGFETWDAWANETTQIISGAADVVKLNNILARSKESRDGYKLVNETKWLNLNDLIEVTRQELEEKAAAR